VPEPDETEEESAGRPIWTGTVTFGLVSVPVNLLPANRPKRVSLRMVSEEGTPLERRYFTSRDDRALQWSDIVRGFEVEKGKFVVLTEEELERLAPEKTRDIDLRLFVEAETINPRYFERGYFLTPAGGSNKAYRLLARVMEETGHAGIATFVMRSKEYLTAIFAENGILRTETLRFADDLRDPESIGLPPPAKPKPAEVKRLLTQMRKLVKADVALSEMKDPSAERMLKLVKKKVRAGEDVVSAPAEESDSSDVIDLLEVLQRRLDASKGGRAKPSAAKSSSRKTTRSARGAKRTRARKPKPA
jgi:DNA end-binding protein Ku